MNEIQQKNFIEQLINENRKNNMPDLLREFREREERRRLNRLREIYENENWWSV